jgi:hypothetical protein
MVDGEELAGGTMAVHDWTLVEAGIFHDFHNCWTTELRNALNGGRLPAGYYALTEQHAGQYILDLLTLDARPRNGESHPAPSGLGTAVATTPPRVQRKVSLESPRTLRRTLAIRHVSGHRLVALVEIVSPANKDRVAHVDEFVRKIADALSHDIHVLMVDILPPGPHDPRGMHGAIHELLGDGGFDLPVNEPLTLASYVSDRPPDAYLNHVAINATMPDMPLFLDPDHYVDIPLESTYQAAYRGTPAVWREVLEGRPPI